MTASDDEREIRYTDSGRKVLGGGGITPDVKVDLDKATHLEQAIERRGYFFEFAVEWISEHGRPQTPHFDVTDDVLAGFRKYIDDRNIEYTPEEWTEALDYIRTMIQAEVVGAAFDLQERQKIIAEKDKQILRALQVLPAAVRLPITAFNLDGLKPAGSEELPAKDQKAGAQIENKEQ